MKAESKIFTELRKSFNKTKLTFRMFRNRIVGEIKPIPRYTRTDAQDEQRTKFSDAVAEWNAMSEAEKEAWRDEAQKLGITPYNAFLKSRLTGMITGMDYEITIDNSQNSEALTDFQVLLEVNNDSDFFSTFNNDHKYIEAYASDQSTMISFWVETWDTGNHNAKIWLKIPSIPANGTTKAYLKANLERTEALSDPEATMTFYDNLESGEIDQTKWDIKQTRGSLGIRTDKVYEGSYSIGSDQGPGQGSGQSVYDQNHYLAKIPLTEIEVGKKLEFKSQSRRWKTTQWYGHFCGYGMGGDAEVYSFSWDDVWHEYKAIITRSAESTWDIEIYKDGSQQTTKQISKSFTDNLLFGVQTRHNGASDNSIYVRSDLIIARKYTEPEPTVTYSKL